jgi:hypothetical protein
MTHILVVDDEQNLLDLVQSTCNAKASPSR